MYRVKDCMLYGLGGLACFSAVSCGSKKEEVQQPNVLLIVVDDMGFSDTQPFGGEINTPNISRLADSGVRFTRFHTSSLSAPTRAMLLTGVDNHQNGLGVMPSLHGTNQYMQPGYEGFLNDRVMTVAEVLRQNNYYTCMTGKWHLGALEGHTPDSCGFDNSFAMLGGGACHFANQFALSDDEAPATFYVENGARLDSLPDDFYSTRFYTDKMMDYLDKCPEDKPFFAYLAYTAPHDPLQVENDWKDKYKGKYDCGYDSIRHARFERLKQLGIVSPDMPYPDLSGENPAWETLTDTQKKEQARKMEIYASMIECVDYNIGRLLDKLEEDGRLDNTLVIFMSDNGANPKEPFNYPGNSPEIINERFDNSIENYGSRDSFISEGAAWAEVSNTPYSRYKMTTNEGGICTPLIVSGKKFVRESHLDTHTLLHVTDLFPTILDFAQAERPAEWNGIRLAPLYGHSFRKNIDEPSAETEDRTLCFEMTENKSVIKGDWKAVMLTRPYGDGNKWCLYNLKDDIAERKDLSDSCPDKLKELVDCWQDYASSVGYIKSDNISMVKKIGAEEFYKYRMSPDAIDSMKVDR